MPVIFAKISAAVFFALIAIVIWRLPLFYTSPSGEAPPLRKDIRFWASLLLVGQLILYAIF